jgi:ribosome recycling factor
MTTMGTVKEAIAAGRTRMEKAVDDFRKELGTLRTGRANASILDSIRVDYHGTPMPVNLGPKRGAADRQGHPEFGPGAESYE